MLTTLPHWMDFIHLTWMSFSGEVQTGLLSTKSLVPTLNDQLFLMVSLQPIVLLFWGTWTNLETRSIWDPPVQRYRASILLLFLMKNMRMTGCLTATLLPWDILPNFLILSTKSPLLVI